MLPTSSQTLAASSEIRNEQPGWTFSPPVGAAECPLLGPSADRRALVSREALMARPDKCPAELQHTHRLETDDYRALSHLLAELLVREA